MKTDLHTDYSPETCGEVSNYYVLFEQATDAIMVTDLQGNLLDANSGLCNLFGYSRQELLQMNVRSLLDEQHLEENPIRFDVIDKGEKIVNERKMVHKDGTIIFAESNAKKFQDNRVLSIVRDITHRKKMEQLLHENEANLHTIFSTTDTIYVLMDPDLRILSYNARALDFAKKELGHDFETNRSFPDYFSGVRRELVELHTSQALAGQHVKYESSYPQHDGTENWYHVRYFPILRNDIMYGVMLAVSDITEKKALESKLLCHKVEEQRKIIRAVLKTQEIERNKIGQELHDNVNQVLTAIRLQLGMIDDGSVQRKDMLEKAREHIDLAIYEIRALSREQVTPPRKFNLKELIEELCSNFNENTTVKTVFQCNVSDNLHIGEDLKLNIYRIVQEQTGNILKHADAEKANLSIHQQDNFIHVLIVDNGRGFDPLIRRQGIGLANMVNRVESYNGEIKLDSHPGRGCKIEISIPV